MKKYNKWLIRLKKGQNIIQQEEQTDKLEQENYELQPETKEIKEENFKKNTPDQIYENWRKKKTL